MTTATETRSLATRMAEHCRVEKLFVTVNTGHEGFPDSFVVRLYGLANNGEGPVGLWQLLTDEEVAALGVEIYRFTGGGLILPKSDRRTVQALAVCVWRLLGKVGKNYPNVVFL